MRFAPLTALLGALLALLPPAAARAADSLATIAAHLVGQRAKYTLNLASSTGDIIAGAGTMTYDVTDACTGWATQQRLAMALTNRDGQTVQMVSDYATLESKDGLNLEFHMRQTTDTAVTEQVDGRATLQSLGGPGSVHYTTPADRTMPLPAGTLFPMYHTATIIAAAEEGKRFSALPLFDGTGPDGAQDSSIVVISWGDKTAPATVAPATTAPATTAPGDMAPSPDRSGGAAKGGDPIAPPRPDPRVTRQFPALSALPNGRVRVSFFDRKPGDQEPDYSVGMRYWANGVADNLSMNFGDFVMDAKLAELALPKPHC